MENEIGINSIATPVRISDLPMDAENQRRAENNLQPDPPETERKAAPEAQAQSPEASTSVGAEPLVEAIVGIPATPAAPVDLLPTDDAPKKRGRGRPPGSKNRPEGESASVIIEPQAAPEPAVVVPQVDYVLMSQMLFDMSTNSLAIMFGPEWQARDDNEKNAVCQSLAAYLRSKQVQDIPPGMMLTIVLCAYSAPRLRAPATASKLKLAWYWLRNKFASKKGLTVVK